MRIKSRGKSETLAGQQPRRQWNARIEMRCPLTKHSSIPVLPAVGPIANECWGSVGKHAQSPKGPSLPKNEMVGRQ